MKNIKLDEVRPGMVLARDVKGRFGRGLLLAGNVVTEKHVKIFKSWGITELIIEKNPVSDEVELKKPAHPQYARIEARTRELFKFNDIKHPAVRELFQISLDRKIKFQTQRES